MMNDCITRCITLLMLVLLLTASPIASVMVHPGICRAWVWHC
jgi:hypothetical protein